MSRRIDYVTPTGLAEEVYQAKRNYRAPMPIGPAGLPVPPANVLYRKEQDGRLLINLARAAYAAHAERMLPTWARAQATAVLLADVVKRFPQDDMRILERYGCARAHDRISIELGDGGEYLHGPRLRLAEPVLAPVIVPNLTFYADLGGAPREASTQLPAALLPFCKKVAVVERDRRRFDNLYGFTSQFRVREGRWPRWYEIERELPEFRDFMAAQRAGR